MPGEYEKRHLIAWLRAEMARATGRRYDHLDLDALSIDGLRDLQRLLRDFETEKQRAINAARLQPWRS